MSCGAPVQKFRLLDAYVGWDPALGSPEFLIGVDDPTGLRLAPIDPDAVWPSDVDGFIPPPLLTPGCDPCTWFLGAGLPPIEKYFGQMLTVDRCSSGWETMQFGCCEPLEYGPITGVAYWRHRIAVADVWNGKPRTRVISEYDGRILAEMKAGGPIAFTHSGELLSALVKGNKSIILRFSREGPQLGRLAVEVEGVIERMAEGRDCRLWMLVRVAADRYRLGVVARDGRSMEWSDLESLAKVFPRNAIAASGAKGFCLAWRSPDGERTVCCYSWTGECLPDGSVAPPAKPRVEKQGQLLTLPIDSGVPACRWHRVRVDADVPPGTSVEVSVSTSELEIQPEHGNPLDHPEWSTFQAGAPYKDDWQVPGTQGQLDFLVRQPAGQLLYCRIRLRGDGIISPVVRRVRMDFERATSLEFMPAVYRENPEAEDFTERYLSIYDAVMERMDSAIVAAPALLDSQDVPGEVLPWIATFYALTLEREWTLAQRREVLRQIPSLYRKRGTVSGLREAIACVFGLSEDEVAIEEMGLERAWGALGAFRVRESRLFSRRRARFLLSSSPLGGAPLRNLGDASLDAITTHAYRFRVLIPPVGAYGPISESALAQLVEAQKPAHTLAARMRNGGRGFILGRQPALGVDTVMGSLPAPVLGAKGNIRLGRQSILWHSERGPRPRSILSGGAAGVDTNLN